MQRSTVAQDATAHRREPLEDPSSCSPCRQPCTGSSSAGGEVSGQYLTTLLHTGYSLLNKTSIFHSFLPWLTLLWAVPAHREGAGASVLVG